MLLEVILDISMNVLLPVINKGHEIPHDLHQTNYREKIDLDALIDTERKEHVRVRIKETLLALKIV